MRKHRPEPHHERRDRMLSDKELERYARHIVLREVGGPGQTALKEASVLVIGAGGLGAPALMYLAAAGVGTLGVVDDDRVSLSNLQRQIIHTTPEIGRLKVDSAAEQIRALNPHVLFESHAVRLNAENAMSLIGGYDLVLDGSDNFETRYLVADACYLAGKPLITAALGQFDGSLTTIRAHERGADGQFNPTYRCLFPEPPPPGTVPAWLPPSQPSPACGGGRGGGASASAVVSRSLRRQLPLTIHVRQLRFRIALAGSHARRKRFREIRQMRIRQFHLERAERLGEA